MVTLSAHASGNGVLLSVTAHTGIAIAVELLSLAVYFCYGYAPLAFLPFTVTPCHCGAIVRPEKSRAFRPNRPISIEEIDKSKNDGNLVGNFVHSHAS